MNLTKNLNKKQLAKIDEINAKIELPICEFCKEESESINDFSGMSLCSDCFSDAGY